MSKLTVKQEAQNICMIKATDLIPYANNARTHSDEQVTQIASSIKEFGFTNPVLIDSDNGIIAGHGRIQAALKLDMVEVPTICLENLTKPQIKAYILADNRLAENAGWDLDLVSIELQELKDLDFDIELTGFSDIDIENIIGGEFPELADGDKEPFQQMTFTLHAMQAHHLKKDVEFRTWQKLKGYQLKYIYFIDKTAKERLTVPIIPFSKIDEMGASMYKGKRIKRRLTEEQQIPSVEGGASPTSTLQTKVA